MLKTKEMHVPRNLERIKAVAPLMGYNALVSWFNSLEPKNPTHRAKPLSIEEGMAKTVFMRAALLSNTATLTIGDAQSPQDRVRLYGRRTFHPDDEIRFKDVDSIANNELAWRINSATNIDLIPRGTVHRRLYEPAIVKVEASEPINYIEAEDRFLETIEQMKHAQP